MKHSIAFFFLTCFLLSSCNPTTPTLSAEPVTVQYTIASSPWLAELYTCAEANVVDAEQRAAELQNPQLFDLAIRIGQPENLTIPAYRIGSEDILVIANNQNPIKLLTADEVRELFSGQIVTWQEDNGSTTPVQVWVFAAGEDIQQVFELAALSGSPITSTARLAATMEEMSQAIANDVNAIGILSRPWKAGNVSEVFTVPNIPVLALTPGEPQGAIEEILACLQK